MPTSSTDDDRSLAGLPAPGPAAMIPTIAACTPPAALPHCHRSRGAFDGAAAPVRGVKQALEHVIEGSPG
jgi:hypothetical protein